MRDEMTTPEGKAMWVLTYNDEIEGRRPNRVSIRVPEYHGLSPTEARWLALRLIRAANEIAIMGQGGGEG